MYIWLRSGRLSSGYLTMNRVAKALRTFKVPWEADGLK